MMTRNHQQTQLSRADLLWSFAAVEKQQQEDLAVLLGFEKRKNLNSVNITLGALVVKARGTSEIVTEQPQKIVQSQQTASYYRLTEISHDSKTEDSVTLEQNNDSPDWYKDAKPSYFSKTKSSIPLIHQTLPVFQPLMPWSRLWPFLYRVLGASNLSNKADVVKLVDQVAQGKTIRQLPRLQHQTWSEFSQILIDINETNFPYRNDFFYLCDQLKKLRGEQGLDIQYINDEPGGAVIRYNNQQEIIKPWVMPNVECKLLILSDLGMHTKSRRIVYDWLVFGQQLAVQGCRPVVLMPVAERDVDKRLLTYFDCVVWDGNSRLKTLTGQYEPQHSEQEQQQTLETLLACFFPAVRVDVGLVRAIRQLLSADQFDIGHESALWHHPAVNQQHEQWGWQSTSRKNYAQKFISMINALSENKQKKLIQLIADYHALMPEELYFEAMADLLKPETKDLLPAQVKKNTERFMADLLKTYQENEQHQGLDGWVSRYLARHDHAVLRQDDEFYIGFLAYAKTRYQQDEVISWPEDIPSEKILSFINQKQSQQGYYLKQKGNKLELLSAELFKQEADDWGNNGIIIATITTRDTQLFYWQTEKNGQSKTKSINLKALDKKVFSLPLAEQYQFQIGKEKITVEATASMENLPWAFALGMSEKQGSYVETLDNTGNVYRWFWHPPEWKQGAGLLRGVWYLENFNQLTLPSWANHIDRDQYGFYAEFEIKGIVSRMRWIEPGQFMMGSPGNEAERRNNEVLHEVSLSQGFWLADTACTQALWKAVMGKNPSHFKNEMNPVEKVSWDDINMFLKQTNRLKPELALRLPSEAQWEYSCRAGKTSPFSFGENITPEQVNYDGNMPYDKAEKGICRNKTVKVKSLPANDWGLFEMHGNVWEWCQDVYVEDLSKIQNDKAGQSRVLRGGSWINYGRNLRSAYRSPLLPDYRYRHFGFRLAGGYGPQPVRQVKSNPAANYASPVAEQG